MFTTVSTLSVILWGRRYHKPLDQDSNQRLRPHHSVGLTNKRAPRATHDASHADLRYNQHPDKNVTKAILVPGQTTADAPCIASIACARPILIATLSLIFSVACAAPPSASFLGLRGRQPLRRHAHESRTPHR